MYVPSRVPHARKHIVAELGRYGDVPAHPSQLEAKNLVSGRCRFDLVQRFCIQGLAHVPSANAVATVQADLVRLLFNMWRAACVDLYMLCAGLGRNVVFAAQGNIQRIAAGISNDPNASASIKAMAGSITNSASNDIMQLFYN